MTHYAAWAARSGTFADGTGVDKLATASQTASVSINQLRILLEAVPFVPFSVILPNGEKLRVPHSDFAWIHPGGRSIVIAAKGDVMRIVNCRW